MIEWYFCAKPARLWFVIKVFMQHPPHITEMEKTILKWRCFTTGASTSCTLLSAVTCLFRGVYETPCPLLDALSSLFAVRQWRHCCLASYPSVEEMRGPDGGWWRQHQACPRQYQWWKIGQSILHGRHGKCFKKPSARGEDDEPMCIRKGNHDILKFYAFVFIKKPALFQTSFTSVEEGQTLHFYLLIIWLE